MCKHPFKERAHGERIEEHGDGRYAGGGWPEGGGGGGHGESPRPPRRGGPFDVEQPLNELLDDEADRVAGAGKYERSQGSRRSSRAYCTRSPSGEDRLRTRRPREIVGDPRLPGT